MTLRVRILAGLAVFLLTPLVIVRSIEDSMIYFPTRYPEGYWSPEQFGMSVEDCYFESEDGVRLHGWYAECPGVRRTLLWCHGNAGNVTDRIEQIKLFVEKIGTNVFIFDYRGYGRSAGEPGENGLYRDGRAAYDYLIHVRKIDPSDLATFGQSLGGAIAVDVAANRRCARLILEATFTSARDMARRVFPLLPVGWVIRTRFDSMAKISRLSIPLLMFHGDNDQTVPLEFGERLFQAANPPKQFVVLPGSDHNDTYLVGGRLYIDSFKNFLREMR